ncbi:MAG: acetolactate decarboxylase, partial [bacterium]|nr:acetolactate decarboxylase [bacterium]
LSDVLEHEVRFPFDSWAGTLVGFRFADVRDGVSIPGLHLHAISQDRRSGGHCHHATVRAAMLTAWLDDVDFVTQ